MFSVLNSTDYPIIFDGDENAIMRGHLNSVRVFSENRFGERVYVGLVTERAESLTRSGMLRYAYTGYGFPDSIETDSAQSINKVVVLSVREWAESA